MLELKSAMRSVHAEMTVISKIHRRCIWRPMVWKPMTLYKITVNVSVQSDRREIRQVDMPHTSPHLPIFHAIIPPTTLIAHA